MIKIILLISVILLTSYTSDAQTLRDDIKKYVYKLGFKYPDIVYQQFKIESASGKSNLAVNYNNLTGMKFPTVRLTTSIGKTKSGFAIYGDWRDSIIDRLLLDYYSQWNNLSREDYLNKMRTIYCKNCKNYLAN